MAEQAEGQSLEGFELKIAPELSTHEEILSALSSRFQLVQSHYNQRNKDIDARRAFFRGEHWVEPASETEEGEFRLVINYCRRVVLDFAGMLARAPTPRVPIPPSEDDSVSAEAQAARRREQLLKLVWDDFLIAWRKAELNAAKCSYGVVECIWNDAARPDELPIKGAAPPEPAVEGEEAPPPPPTLKRYMNNPFTFRSIKPEDFYPIYKTFDRSDDFLYVFRWDPKRLKTDIELRYNILLGQTDTTLTGTEATVDLIEYWDDMYYVLVARTVMEVPAENQRGGILARFRRTQDPLTIPSYTVLVAKKHIYAREPFWVVQNLEDTDQNPTDGGSISDIEDISVLNQHLNLMRSEQAEEIVTNIHRPLVYQSDDHSQNPKSLAFTAGAVYPIGSDEELKPIEHYAQPEYVEKHIAETERTIRTLSFLGDAGFGDFASGTSGVAARIALTPMQRILELKLPPRTYVLASIGSFLLRCLEQKLPKDAKLRGWVKLGTSRFEQVEISADDIAGQYYVNMDYGNLLPRDDNAHQQNESYKYGAHLQSLHTTLENMGHEDPAMEIQRIKSELKDPWLNPERWLAAHEAVQAKVAMENASKEQQTPEETAPEEIGPVATGLGSEQGPPVPGAALPQAPNEGGFGPGALAPFLQRNQERAAGLPQTTAGPGISAGAQ